MTDSEYIEALKDAISHDCSFGRKVPKDRFWSRVDKTPGHGPKGDCWIWTGSRKKHGYGQIGMYMLFGTCRPVGAHCVSYELVHGRVPEGKEICHSCDNPPCVNPAHLFAGTHKRNMYDAILKGRLPFNLEKRNPERQKRIKFTPEQQAIIKAARKAKRLSIYDMGQVLDLDYTRYHRLETDEPTCTFERYHFLLRFLELDEQSLGVTPDQFYQLGQIGKKSGAARKNALRSKVFRTHVFQQERPHKFWSKLPPPELNDYGADLIRETLRSMGIPITRLAPSIGIHYSTLMRVLKGQSVSDGVLLSVIKFVEDIREQLAKAA